MVKGGSYDGAPSLSDSDMTRQAELVAMEYLKSAKSSKTLDAIMSQGSGLASASPLSSELYAEDLEKKKKSGARSVLEYIASKMDSEFPSETSRAPSPSALDSTMSQSSSSRRRASADEPGEEKASVEWTKDEVSLLKKAIKQTNAIEDKNDRWKQIANLVGNGKNKKHCYLKYKELKDEKSSSKPSGSDGRSSRRSSSDEKGSHRKSSSSHTSEPVVAKDGGPPVTTPKPTAKTHNGDEEDDAAPAMIRVPLPAAKKSSKPTKAEELQMEDCDDFDAPSSRSSTLSHPGRTRDSSATTSHAASVPARAPTADEVDALRGILFPDDRKNFSSHWDEQGFFFSDFHNLRYGLVQNEGGPCGVLAVVQAFVLRFLLKSVQPSDWRNPTQREQEQAIVLAVSHILWQAARASKRSQCMVAVNDEKSAASNAKRKFMSGTQVYTMTTLEQTQTLLSQHLRQFTAPKGNGLVLLVLSTLLSKGVEAIKPEMDSVEGTLGGGGKLIGGHDYCTQEIVNLLLCGVASSNVFNGRQLLDGTGEDDPKAIVLKGIPARGDVGFLSLFEAYEYILVGSHLKSPRFNIWVVCSESHYSVMFADPKLLISDSIHDKMAKLDVFYFDGLGSQDEEIRLTVHAFALQEKAKAKHDDLTPPLNLVLQTKWPLARIDWNGVEPLL